MGKPYLVYARARDAGPPRGMLCETDVTSEILKPAEPRTFGKMRIMVAKATKQREGTML